MTLKLLYFAWLRERIGEPGETVETQAQTVSDLIAELQAKDPRYAAAFADISAIRVAIDQTLVDLDTPLGSAQEVAFFPPMTGG